jgi:hypothetical protein
VDGNPDAGEPVLLCMIATPVVPRRAAHRRNRRRKVLMLGAACCLPLLCATFCVGPPGYYSAKYSSAGAASPLVFPIAAEPERQTEPHTCGLHALSSLYRAYRLDPERLRLRFRIGVDKPVSNFFPDTTGTIHPDILRVVEQDGFEAEVLRPSDSATRLRVEEHLRRGHYALVLIRVNELHWVLFTGLEGDRAVVCDSLETEAYDVAFREYLAERVYSVVLIRPR